MNILVDWIMNISADWITRIISGVALLVATLSFVRSKQTKRRDWRIEAGKIAAEIGLALSTIPQRANKTKSGWHALLAVNGNFHSGAKIKVDNDINQRNADAQSLAESLSKAMSGVNKMSDSELERLLIQLQGLRKQSSDLHTWFDSKDLEQEKLAAQHRDTIASKYS